jgi:hypothetical protein
LAIHLVMNKFFPFFGDRLVINLDKEKDRLESFYSRLNSFGILNVKRFPAVFHKSGLKGCGFSHLNIIKEAKKRALPSVFVFEDDAEFIDFDEEILNKVALYLKNNPWEIVRLSYTYRQNNPEQMKEIGGGLIVPRQSNLIEFKKHPHLVWLTNFAAVGYHCSTFDTIINSFHPETCEGIDAWMPTHFNSLCVTPQMVIQDEPKKIVTLPSGKRIPKREMHLNQRNLLRQTYESMLPK